MTAMAPGYTRGDLQLSVWLTLDEHRRRGHCWHCRPDGTCGQLAWAQAYEAESRRPQPAEVPS